MNKVFHDKTSQIAGVLIAGGVLIFLILACIIHSNPSPDFDRAIVLSFRNPADLHDPIGPLWLEVAARDMTALGGTAFLLFLTLTIVGFLWIMGQPRAMALVLIATIGGTLLNSLLKGFFARPRPDFVPHLQHAYLASFPSGHSLMSAVVYLTLASMLIRLVNTFWLKAYLLIIAGLMTFLVGISRVYLGVHYPTDVLAGWGIGIAWATFCWLVMRALQKKGEVESSPIS